MARKREKKPEAFSGGHGAMPHVVFDGEAFAGCSSHAKAILFALIRQANGSNNGHYQLTTTWLAKRGYKSPSQNIKATKELIARGLVVQTKHGGLNNGCNLFAVTWLIISNFIGLDIEAADYKTGLWSRIKLPPEVRRQSANLIPKIKKQPYAHRNCAVTPIETDTHLAVTPIETENAHLAHLAVTPIENNVFNTNTPVFKSGAVKRQPIVGKAKHLRKVKHAS